MFGIDSLIARSSSSSVNMAQHFTILRSPSLSFLSQEFQGEDQNISECKKLALIDSQVLMNRLQRDQDFSIPGFPGRDFAKSRDPGIFRDGISLKFLSQDYTKKVWNLWGFHYQLINLVNFIHFGGLVCL